jgi:type IV pilus assembly protein PilA
MKKTQKRLGNKGFSLVELIVVIAIMAVLVGVLAPTLIRNVEKSRESKDAQNIDSIKNAIEVALQDEDAYSAAVGNTIVTVESAAGSTDVSIANSTVSGKMKETLDTTKTKLASKKYKKSGVKVEFKVDDQGHVSVVETGL